MPTPAPTGGGGKPKTWLWVTLAAVLAFAAGIAGGSLALPRLAGAPVASPPPSESAGRELRLDRLPKTWAGYELVDNSPLAEPLKEVVEGMKPAYKDAYGVEGFQVQYRARGSRYDVTLLAGKLPLPRRWVQGEQEKFSDPSSFVLRTYDKVVCGALPPGSLSRKSDEEIEKMLQTKTTGPIHCVRQDNDLSVQVDWYSLDENGAALGKQMTDIAPQIEELFQDVKGG